MTELSPAREALAAHLAKIEETYSELSSFSVVGQRLASAHKRQQEAESALTALTDAEDAAWQQWAADPHGPQPEPMDRKRREVLAELAGAKGEVAAAERAAAAVHPRAESLAHELHRFHQERVLLVAQVLADDAERLSREYVAAVVECLRIETALHSIAAWSFKSGASAIGSRVLTLRRGERQILDPKYAAQCRELRADTRRIWQRYIERLTANAKATVKT
jgi:hypothetical protein